jgi:hypothetical protein
MTSYTITANGTEMGSYEGATREDAVLAYVRDAGYASVEDAAEALSMTPEAFLADIDVAAGDITTASECVGMSSSAILDALAPGGRAVTGVTVEQDWDRGTTAIFFEDGSSVVIDGRDIRVTYLYRQGSVHQLTEDRVRVSAPKRGRPRLKEPREVELRVRLTQRELDALRECAESRGVTVAALVRRALDVDALAR